MKKFLSLLLLALPLAFLNTACDDDNDLPNVDVSVAIENGTKVGNQLYVVRGDTLKIEGIYVKNNEEGKGATLINPSFYWDGLYIGIAIYQPYAFNVVTVAPDEEKGIPGTPLGRHTLSIEATLLAVDKEIANCLLQYTVNVVESADQIPEGGAKYFDATFHPKD